MCDICRRVVCPVGCPNHETEEYGGDCEICSECGAEIPRGTLFYRFDPVSVCAECAERLDISGILRLTRLPGTYAILDAVGAVREWRA